MLHAAMLETILKASQREQKRIFLDFLVASSKMSCEGREKTEGT